MRLGGHTPHINGAFYSATSEYKSFDLASARTNRIGVDSMFSSRMAVAVALAVLAGHDARCADLPRKAPSIAPAPPVALSWTGFYVGAHAGYSWGRWDGDLTFDPGTGPIVVFDPSNRKIDANGWLAGGQIGFNYQINSFVFGLEADASWTNLKGNGNFNTSLVTLIGQSKINLIGSEPFAAVRVLRSTISCFTAPVASPLGRPRRTRSSQI
jgi:hypothetical protein